jgi:murein tripeptide amidase MpaA
MPSAPSYDEFYDAARLADLLAGWAAERPDLMAVESIGRSWQGRDIWLVTCTDASTGPAAEKPALFVEANIHAAELTGSTAALHLLHRLITGGDDPRIARLLRTRAVYVVPRLCPDGAEEVLRTGRYVRSSLRPHPDPEPAPGLHQGDVDGDGRSLFMRVPDPRGPWKASAEDPRLLVRREPDEEGGDYYRLLLEGEVLEYDGATVPVAPAHEGLDLAGNFHSDWPDLSARPREAGPYAGSEPEVQALLRAVVDRPNITGYLSLHTFGAVHLRPPLNDDDPLPIDDLLRYAHLGARAEELTGYPVMSYDELKHAPYRVRGGQLAWLYRERGVYAWITELWNPLRAAGVDASHPARWLVEHDVDDDLALLRWSDAELGGRGFVDWYPFDHPQLGKVEIGGWDIVGTWYNPPARLREQEVAPVAQWAIFLALASPLLEVVHLEETHVDGEVHLVRAVVANTGWLPTHVTEQARQRAQVPPVTVTLTLPDGAILVGGTACHELGQLAGRSGARSSTTWWGHEPGTPDRALAEWVVRAPAGSVVRLTAAHPRAGVARAEVTLTDSHDPTPADRSSA